MFVLQLLYYYHLTLSNTGYRYKFYTIVHTLLVPRVWENSQVGTYNSPAHPEIGRRTKTEDLIPRPHTDFIHDLQDCHIDPSLTIATWFPGSPRQWECSALIGKIIYLFVCIILILDTEGLQSPASRTGLSSPLDLTVANSAPSHYSHNWVYSPCADNHKLLLVKSWFFLQYIH
jgi:hypothetical protein